MLKYFCIGNKIIVMLYFINIIIEDDIFKGRYVCIGYFIKGGKGERYGFIIYVIVGELFEVLMI